MGFRCLQTCSMLLVILGASTFSEASSRTDHTAAALRKLKTATQQQRNGEHLANLSALRSLHDPALKPFFYNLVQHNNWSIQVHAVLGLAELSEDGRIDPWLVQQVSPLAREQLVIKSLSESLLSLDGIKSLLDWSLLEPAQHFYLLLIFTQEGSLPIQKQLRS